MEHIEPIKLHNFLVSLLVRRFGARATCISGAVVACVGLSLSILSKNIGTLILTYGIIGGFGIGMITLPTVIIVGYYFESKREHHIYH